MVTPDQMRRLCLALPEAEEHAHFGQPDFRVRGKIFAGLSREGESGTLKLTSEAQAMLLEARSAAFYPAKGAWGQHGWTHVRLDEVQLGELESLLRESFDLVAPKQLTAGGLGATKAKSPAKSKTIVSPAKRKASRKATKRTR